MSYAIKQHGKIMTYDDKREGVYLFDSDKDAKDYLSECDEKGEIVDMVVENFTSGTYHLVDSTYNADSAVSVYVYIEHKNEHQLWYIVNDRGLYYTVFDNMSDLMVYLDGDVADRYCDLTPHQMLLVDKDIDKVVINNA